MVRTPTASWFILALTLATAAARIPAADVITPESVGGQNVRVAEAFIRSTGDSALADNIESFLVKGYLYREDLGTGQAGKTSAFNNISLDPTIVTPLAGNVIKDFDLTIRLAATLTHEKRHAHQSAWDKVAYGDWKEFDAWTTEILEIDSWIRSVRGKYRASNDTTDLAHLKSLFAFKDEVLEEFINDQNCFGYGCDAWKDLRATIQLGQTRLSTTPAKTADQKIGMVIDKADKDERVALGTVPVPSGGCWSDPGGHVVPAATYAPAGAIFDDPRDPRNADAGGVRYARLVDGSWIDLGAGRTVPPDDLTPQGSTFASPSDRTSASLAGRRFVRVSCSLSSPMGAPSPGSRYFVVGGGVDRSYFPDFTSRVGDQSGISTFTGDNYSWGAALNVNLEFPAKPYFVGAGYHFASQMFMQAYGTSNPLLPTSVTGTVRGGFLDLHAGYHLCHFGLRQSYLVDVFGGPTWAWDAAMFNDLYQTSGQTENRAESGLKWNLGAALTVPVEGRWGAQAGLGYTTAFKSADADLNWRLTLGVAYSIGSAPPF